MGIVEFLGLIGGIILIICLLIISAVTISMPIIFCINTMKKDESKLHMKVLSVIFVVTELICFSLRIFTDYVSSWPFSLGMDILFAITSILLNKQAREENREKGIIISYFGFLYVFIDIVLLIVRLT